MARKKKQPEHCHGETRAEAYHDHMAEWESKAERDERDAAENSKKAEAKAAKKHCVPGKYSKFENRGE